MPSSPSGFMVLLVLVAGIALPACAAGSSTPPAEFAVDRYEIVTGSEQRQTVLTGVLLGGVMADIAVLTIDEAGDRRLRIFAFDEGGWVPRIDTHLRSEVRFVDVAEIDGRDRLIAYEPGLLLWFDPESAKELPLVTVTSDFDPPRRDEIPHVSLTRDVSGDDREDLVVPDEDGFWVFTQLGDGAFAQPVKIGPPTDLSRIYGADGYRYDPWSQSRVHEVDYDQDGRRDLMFWNEDHFEVHRQDARGLFLPVPETVTTEVAIDSDDLSSLAVGEMTGRVLHSLADLNGDGVADLVVVSLEGASLSSKRSSYEVHLGAPTPEGGTAFRQGVDIAFRPNGRIQLRMERHDLDRDGRSCLMFTTIDLKHLEGSLWKTIKGAMGDDIWLSLEFYRTEDDLDPDRPDTTRTIALDGVPSHREPGWVPLDVVLRGRTHERRRTQEVWRRAFNRTWLIGDVTGDGRSDLLIEPEFRELYVFAGVPGPELFARRPQELAVILPNDEEYTWLDDLNKDGKQDLLMHHRFTLRDAHGAPKLPPGSEPQRVTVLIAR